jgi:hypothetical protein
MKSRSLLSVLAVFLMLGAVPGRAAFDKAGVLGVGARPLGMGDAFVAIANEAMAINWNPAGLTQLSRYEVAGFLGPLLNGKEYYMSGAVAVPFMADTALGFSAISLYHNTGDSRTDAYENTFLLSGATPLNVEKTVSVGLNLKFLQYSSNASADIPATVSNSAETIQAQASTIGVDLGFLYQIPLPSWGKRVSLGFEAQDLDTVLHWQSGSEERVPLMLQAGVAYWLEENVVAAVDFSFLNDTNISGQPLETPLFEYVPQYDQQGNPVYYPGTTIQETTTAQVNTGETVQYRPHLGLEGWFFNDHLGLRTGYTGFATTSGRFTAGVSYKADQFRVDYAYIGHAEHLGDSHRLSASYYFGSDNGAFRVVSLVYPPNNVKATADNNTVELTWSANPDPHVTGYTIYMSKSAGSSYTAIAKRIKETKTRVEGLSNGTRYYFVVTSVNNSWPASESTYSPEVSAVPGPPGMAQLGGPAPAAANTGCFPVRGLTVPMGSTKGYIVYYTKTPGFGYVQFNTKDKLITDVSNIQITGVEPNTDYWFKVVGVSPSGAESGGSQEIQVHSTDGCK